MGEAKRKAARERVGLSKIALTVFLSDDSVPTEFRIFCNGVNASEKGDFLFDKAAADSVMAQYKAHGKPMLLDFNHGTTLAAPTPEQAIAAGEFTPEVREDGLYATNVKWTERAAKAVAAREYRLFSPYFEHDKATGRIQRLINVALTNLPALNHIAPLLAASANDRDQGDEDMEEELKKLKATLEELRAALSASKEECSALKAAGETSKMAATVGLSANASIGEVATAASSLVALRSKVRDLTGQANDSGALGVVEAWKAEAATAGTLKAEKEALVLTTLTAEVKTILDGAGKDGKVPPAQRESLEKAVLGMGAGKVCQNGVDWLKGHVATLSGVVTIDPTKVSTTATVALSAEQRKIAKDAGSDPDKLAAFIAEKEAKRASA